MEFRTDQRVILSEKNKIIFNFVVCTRFLMSCLELILWIMDLDNVCMQMGILRVYIMGCIGSLLYIYKWYNQLRKNEDGIKNVVDIVSILMNSVIILLIMMMVRNSKYCYVNDEWRWWIMIWKWSELIISIYWQLSLKKCLRMSL